MSRNNHIENKKKYIRILDIIKDSDIRVYKNCLFINETDIAQLRSELSYTSFTETFNKKYLFEYGKRYFYLKYDEETLAEGESYTGTYWTVNNKKASLETFTKVYTDYFLNEIVHG